MKPGITKEELINYFSTTNAVKFEVFNKREIDMNFQPVIEEFLNKIKNLEIQNKELLEACKAMAGFQDYEHMCDDEDYCQEDREDCAPCKLEKAIEKAEGES